MDPITLAMSLGQFVPGIVKWLTGSDKAEAVAAKVVDIAQAVTGKSGANVLPALTADPALVMQFRQAVLAQELELEKLAYANSADINKTMQAEAGAEHWPTYSWRPYIGFCFGTLGLLVGLVAVAAYVGVMFFNVKTDVLAQLPGLLAAVAAVMTTMAAPLGIASWFRGKAQADPAIPPAIQIPWKGQKP